MFEGIKRRKFYFYKSKKEARQDYLSFREILRMGLVVSALSVLFYPPFSLTVLISLLIYYFARVHSEYFSGVKRYLYERLMVPLVTAEHFIRIGFEIYKDSEELNKHFSILEKEKNERRKKLAKLAEFVKNNEPWRIVGLSIDTLTRHLWLIGSTGAGKTSLIMTGLKKAFEQGAGAIMVDGKSDAKMFQKLYSLAVETGREHDVYCINFLKPDQTTFDSNSFSPIASLSANAQVEFLSSVASNGGSGDMAYWEGRGKNLLMPVIYFYDFRKRFYKENYSYETIAGSLSTVEFAFIPTLIFLMAVRLNEQIKNDKRMNKFLKEGRKIATPKDMFVPELEVLTTYMIQFPHRAVEIEKNGYSKKFIETLYRIYAMTFNTYLASVSTSWMEAIRYVARRFYTYLEDLGLNPLEMRMEEFRVRHQEIMEKLMQEVQQMAQSKNPEAEKLNRVLQLYKMPEEKDKQQHQYAQQQWDLLFQSFRQFSHIFGSLDPDVDMLDVVRNNKILYVLLPPLEQDKKTTEMLGKALIIAIKAASSVALGGKLENLTKTQQDIVQNIITPIPVGIVVLDEYGAYPVPSIDTIAAQVRSINISLWFSTQDYVSAKVGGTDETSAKRVWANTNTKIILKIEDSDTPNLLAERIGKEYVASLSKATKLDDSSESLDLELSVTQESIVDPSSLLKFKDGFSLVLSNGQINYVQSFWADQPPIDILHLNRYEPVR